jgi:hypothetical protein
LRFAAMAALISRQSELKQQWEVKQKWKEEPSAAQEVIQNRTAGAEGVHHRWPLTLLAPLHQSLQQ